VPTRLRHLARDLGTAALGGRSRQGFAYSGRSLPVCLPPTPQHRRERQRRIGPWRTSTFDQPYGRSGFHSNTRYPIPRFETSRGFCRSWEELAAAQGGFARGWALWQRTALLEVGRQEPHNFLALGVAHFFARHFEQAKAMLLRSLQVEPNWVPTHRFLAACCAQMGRFDEAHEMVRRLRAITPVVLPDATHWRNPEHRELYLSGLRLAAGEAT
jgi:tetratricopeptide (TPR) repeat protein